MDFGLGKVPYHFQVLLFTSELGMTVTARIVLRIRSKICKAPSTVPPAWWWSTAVSDYNCDPDSKTFPAFLGTTILLPQKSKSWGKKKENH